jgi:hypothetical protein
MPGVTFSRWTIIPPTFLSYQDDLSQRNLEKKNLRAEQRKRNNNTPRPDTDTNTTISNPHPSKNVEIDPKDLRQHPSPPFLLKSLLLH